MHQRLQKLREQLQHKELPALLITHPANRRYVSGFDGSSGVLLVTASQSYLITDSRYLEQARDQAPQFTVVSWEQENLARCLSSLLDENTINLLGFEEKHLTFSTYQGLVSGLVIELIPSGGMIEQLRAIKDRQETDLLRRGAAMLDEAFNYILTFIKPGLTEQQVSLELEYYLRRKGAQGIPFPYIVASGPRGALPHGVASDKVLQAGELVTIDFGAIWEGYATDMTRTISLGSPDQRQREVYQVVKEAQQRAREGITAGLSCRQADALARKPIKEAGLGDYFGHGLGHGVGVEVHELPVLSWRSEELLQPGMVVTVEPGVYIPGWGGIRIEDMVLLEEDGTEKLTDSCRELIVV
ncbi:MAG TPA: aminopeptidase P family protein [Firmicutes bacterium]|nr:aminopeptidase P family protein [Bacillota bacterium]